MKKRQFFYLIGATFICAIIYSIISSIVLYDSLANFLPPNLVFLYLVLNFFMGLLFSGVPIFIIAIIINIVRTYKKNREHKTEERIEEKKEIPEGMKYCSTCGEKIKKQATYCEFCGSEQ